MCLFAPFFVLVDYLEPKLKRKFKSRSTRRRGRRSTPSQTSHTGLLRIHTKALAPQPRSTQRPDPLVAVPQASYHTRSQPFASRMFLPDGTTIDDILPYSAPSSPMSNFSSSSSTTPLTQSIPLNAYPAPTRPPAETLPEPNKPRGFSDALAHLASTILPPEQSTKPSPPPLPLRRRRRSNLEPIIAQCYAEKELEQMITHRTTVMFTNSPLREAVQHISHFSVEDVVTFRPGVVVAVARIPSGNDEALEVATNVNESVMNGKNVSQTEDEAEAVAERSLDPAWGVTLPARSLEEASQRGKRRASRRTSTVAADRSAEDRGRLREERNSEEQKERTVKKIHFDESEANSGGGEGDKEKERSLDKFRFDQRDPNEENGGRGMTERVREDDSEWKRNKTGWHQEDWSW